MSQFQDFSSPVSVITGGAFGNPALWLSTWRRKFSAFQTWIDHRNIWVVNASVSMLTASGVTRKTFQQSNYPKNDIFSPPSRQRWSRYPRKLCRDTESFAESGGRGRRSKIRNANERVFCCLHARGCGLMALPAGRTRDHNRAAARRACRSGWAGAPGIADGDHIDPRYALFPSIQVCEDLRPDSHHA